MTGLILLDRGELRKEKRIAYVEAVDLTETGLIRQLLTHISSHSVAMGAFMFKLKGHESTFAVSFLRSEFDLQTRGDKHEREMIPMQQ